MEALLVLLFPVVLIFVVLAMELVEGRLTRLTVREEEVSRFLDNANEDEVDDFVRRGLTHALSRFARRKPPAPRHLAAPSAAKAQVEDAGA